MVEKLDFQYDQVGDIFYINKCVSYAEQESEEIGDKMIARLNPVSGEVENLEILFFSKRLLNADFLLELPVIASLRLSAS
jgi:hypothetical protein